MKNLIYQFYNEGFGSIFCKKPINYVNKKIKNKIISKIISILIKSLYTIIVILVASYVFYKKLPF